ncbi:MAG: hypothetical protein ACK5LC_14580 [Coprobacillaceae bacterium]
MKVVVLYTTKSKHVKPVAESMARWVKSHARSIADFSSDEVIDLLVITFDDTLGKDQELYNFISNLHRDRVKNVALVNAFYINNKKMYAVISMCHKADLPLMREQYSWKLTLKQLKQCNQGVIDGARLYIEDMVNVIRNYY